MCTNKTPFAGQETFLGRVTIEASTLCIDFNVQLLSILSVKRDNEWEASDLIMASSRSSSPAGGETMKLMESSLNTPRQIEHVN